MALNELIVALAILVPLVLVFVVGAILDGKIRRDGGAPDGY
jgi:hypothetical protein